MSEVPSEPPPTGQESINRRAWTRERQLRVAGIGTALVLAVALLGWLGGRVFGRHEPTAGEAP